MTKRPMVVLLMQKLKARVTVEQKLEEANKASKDTSVRTTHSRKKVSPMVIADNFKNVLVNVLILFLFLATKSQSAEPT